MSEDLQTLRRDLEANSGMPGLEILQPEDVEAAVRIFHRDGFVVVRDVLTADQVRNLRRGCERENGRKISESTVADTLLKTGYTRNPTWKKNFG